MWKTKPHKDKCFYKNYTCKICDVKGQNYANINKIVFFLKETANDFLDLANALHTMFSLNSDGFTSNKPIKSEIVINKKLFVFGLGTGASVSVISEKFW